MLKTSGLLRIVGLAAAAASVACALEPTPPGSTAAPIVNGELDTGEPATVFISLGGGACTGTLVSPKVVLTAKHCTQGVSVGQIDVFFGNDADGAGTWIGATDYE